MSQDDSGLTYIRIASITAILTALSACDHTASVSETPNTRAASSHQDIEMQEVVIVASRGPP
jgi:hypothetical protein